MAISNFFVFVLALTGAALGAVTPPQPKNPATVPIPVDGGNGVDVPKDSCSCKATTANLSAVVTTQSQQIQRLLTENEIALGDAASMKTQIDQLVRTVDVLKTSLQVQVAEVSALKQGTLKPQVQKFTACPANFKSSPELRSCFLRVWISLNWFDARKYCEVRGGQLLSVDSAAKLDILKNKVFQNENLGDSWASGYLDEATGKWRWVYTGKEFTFSNWDRGEPNAKLNREPCLQLFRSFAFNDKNCQDGNGFVCEFSYA
ncbi:pulmonary surfactant-associated protein D-like [Lingula anatina]|uniref:Pulmonary surfactant-associated protein D-like n=1 Tax=Lingula anatina TaxID=7574 RepID=A0A1S3KHV2_LINAN|nr:pulmonary surfactant-associated protein D-like [Lingula anatina]|eukprot:XP_013422054.1 pulmonary surfactant-associated protein D-like [Lingula anatina]